MQCLVSSLLIHGAGDGVRQQVLFVATAQRNEEHASRPLAKQLGACCDEATELQRTTAAASFANIALAIAHRPEQWSRGIDVLTYRFKQPDSLRFPPRIANAPYRKSDVPAYSAMKPSDFGQGFRPNGSDCGVSLYGKKMPHDPRSALVQ